MSHAEQDPFRPTRRPRRWLRRAGWTLLVLFGIFVIFHRPILRGVIRIVAVKVAAKQNIHLSMTVGGTVLTNLSLENIRATPTGNGPSPVEKISIESVRVRYSLIAFVRRGMREFLQSYELRNAEIVVRPVEGTKSQKRDLRQTLSGILQQPALFSDRVDVRNLNLTAHVPDGEFAIQGISLFLDPVKPGLIEIARIQIPKIRTWENLRATATYANRDLILRGLKLDSDLAFETVELDASRRSENINRLFVRGALFGGETELSLFLQEIAKKKGDLKVSARSRGVSLERMTRYMGMTAPVIGSVGDFSVAMSGDPNVPSTWDIHGLGVIEGLKARENSLDHVAARLDVHTGNAELALEATRDRNKVDAHVTGHLPDDVEAFVRAEFDGTFQVAVPELGQVATNLTGAVTGNGQFGLHSRKFTVGLELHAKDAGKENVNAGLVDAVIEATKLLPEPPPKSQREHETPAARALREQKEQQPAAVTDGLVTKITATLQNLRAGTFALDDGRIVVSSDNARVTIEKAELKRAENTITASGKCDLPRETREIAQAPFEMQFAVVAPSINAFYAEPDLNAPNARLMADGHVTRDGGGYGGKISLSATELVLRDFAAESLSAQIAFSGQTANIEALKFALDGTDGLAGTGRVELRAPFAYDGKFQVNLRDLSKFNAFVPNLKGGIAGAVTVDWEGRGEIEPIRHSGTLQLKMGGGRAGDAVKGIDAEIAGKYSPELIDVPMLAITTDRGDVAAVIRLRDQILEVRDLQVKQGKAALLTGSFSLPLDLRTPKNRDSIIPLAGPVTANLETSEIDLGTVFPKEKPAPATGIVKATISAAGTIEAPNAKVHFDARNLQANAAPKLAPASIVLDMTLYDNQVALQGKFQQPISPVEIAGTVPFPVRQIIAKGKIDEQSPVQLSIRLPQSSVAFLSQAVPDLRYVEGKMSASIDVTGTIANPDLSGAAEVDMPAIRFAKQNLPAIANFRGDLRFAGNQLTINRFGGDISGGPFDLTGSVELPKLTEPVLDLHFGSQGALLVRNETLTVRADSDVQIKGPLNAASVAGAVGVTRSRFFREIEILPIELPGRPAPKPPAETPGFSFDKPPLRDWTFDVKVKTKDPFMIRGNLANGQALIDLALVGTGKAPALDGSVTIHNFVASLPFSKLEVNDSYVYFSPDDPFVPRLDIHGRSTMRDHNILVYIYGTASQPQTVFTSEPPMPQEDIIALLATGTTTSELTGGGDVLAGRALVLATQRLSRMIFKKRPPPESDKESLLSRFNLDVGGVDPKSGQQEVSTSFKVADRFYVIGDLDVQGNVRGQVKYLLRFR